MLEPRTSDVFNAEVQNMQMQEGGAGRHGGYIDDGSLDDLDEYIR